ncbi:unnamed protein product, partial [Penicillium egyptiacum]
AGELRSRVRFRDVSPGESSDESDSARKPHSRRRSTRESSEQKMIRSLQRQLDQLKLG